MKVVTRLQRIPPPTHFLLLGSVIEILYILICTLMPFNTTNTTHWSSSTVWLWVFGSAQPPVLTISIQTLKFTDLVSHFLLLSLIIILLSSAYLYAVGNAFHNCNTLSITTRWLFVPLFGATTFGITLLFLPAFFNIKVSSYLFTGLALLTHLINCVLIWAILSHLAPTRRLGGTILYAWNPLALIELAGNGHNDGLIIFFLLLTTLLIIQQKGRWYDFWAMVFLGCAMSLNVVVLLFAPLIIYFCTLHKTKQRSSGVLKPDGKRTTTTIPLSPANWKRNYIQLQWGLAWRAMIALTTLSALYFLFWRRSLTYKTIISSFDMQNFIHSPLSVLVIPVRWLNNFFFQTLHLSTGISSNYLQPIPAANMAVQASAMFIFALMYIYLLERVRSIDTMLTSLCLTILGFLILLSVQFWPWYILWTLWIIALRRFDALTISVLLLSCTSLLTYPLLYVDNLPIAFYQPLLIFGIPLIYLITRLKRSNERITLFYERRSETAKN